MQVKLKVATGSRAGTEIPINAAKFLIGRGEDCHLRPQSEMVSRHHCLLTIENAQVVATDMGSRNGTFVNGQKIPGATPLKLGDKLKVGPLEFEVLVDHAATGVKRAKISGIADAASRTSDSSAAKKDDSDITAWLEEADNVAKTSRYSEAETRQFSLQDLYGKQGEESESVSIKNDATQEIKLDAPETPTVPAKAKKKSFGKLPDEKIEATNSKEGAAEALKRFFNRR